MVMEVDKYIPPQLPLPAELHPATTLSKNISAIPTPLSNTTILLPLVIHSLSYSWTYEH